MNAFMCFMFAVFGAVASVKEDQLVTMPKEELFSIVSCVTRCKDPEVHKRFEECEKKMPPQVVELLGKCQKKVIPDDLKKCNYYSVLFEKPELVPKIYECIIEGSIKYTAEEKKMMISFEECSRKLYVETCPLSKRLRMY